MYVWEEISSTHFFSTSRTQQRVLVRNNECKAETLLIRKVQHRASGAPRSLRKTSWLRDDNMSLWVKRASRTFYLITHKLSVRNLPPCLWPRARVKWKCVCVSNLTNFQPRDTSHYRVSTLFGKSFPPPVKKRVILQLIWRQENHHDLGIFLLMNEHAVSLTGTGRHPQHFDSRVCMKLLPFESFVYNPITVWLCCCKLLI